MDVAFAAELAHTTALVEAVFAFTVPALTLGAVTTEPTTLLAVTVFALKFPRLSRFTMAFATLLP